MARLRHLALWTQLRSPQWSLLLAALLFSLLRATDQPSVGVGIGGTTASIVPADVLLAALAIVAAAALARGRSAAGAALMGLTAAAFCGLIVVTGALNGAVAFVAAGKVVEPAALGLALAILLRTRAQFDSIIELLLLLTIAADVVGLIHFVANGGGRQSSFLGEHDFAAVAALPLLYGLVLLTDRNSARAWIAIVAGGTGCILGAALASLLGLYLGAAVLLLVVTLHRRLTLRHLAVTVAVVVAVTGGTLALRNSELGFLQSWFGKPPSRPGQYASSWSQRLIFAYIGGRIFLAKPLFGTGWYGDLPPKTFVAYLPDARRRYSDQPSRYFPRADEPFIPQQTFDEVLYELGAAGGLALLAFFVAIGRAVAQSARRGATAVRSLPAAWFAATIGALAGEGLFGGTPLAATLWLVAGIAAAFAARPGELG